MENPVNFLKNSIRYTKALLSNQNRIPEYPCGICKFDVKHNDKSIYCSECEKWIHIKCTDVSSEEYREMQIRNRENPELIDSETWICLKCIMEERLEYSPFIYQSNNQLCNLNALDSMNLFDMLPDDNIFTVALQTNCLNTNDDDDVDESNIENINSKSHSQLKL